jgi:hypothetical protein
MEWLFGMGISFFRLYIKSTFIIFRAVRTHKYEPGYPVADYNEYLSTDGSYLEQNHTKKFIIADGCEIEVDLELILAETK